MEGITSRPATGYVNVWPVVDAITDHLTKYIHALLGIRNFIVQMTVEIASDEGRMRREKAYVNKLNLVLVQVRSDQEWGGRCDHTHADMDLVADPQTSMAARLASVHPRNRRVLENQHLALREQHDDPEAPVRRDF
jgi:hypothetical protein